MVEAHLLEMTLLKIQLLEELLVEMLEVILTLLVRNTATIKMGTCTLLSITAVYIPDSKQKS